MLIHQKIQKEKAQCYPKGNLRIIVFFMIVLLSTSCNSKRQIEKHITKLNYSTKLLKIDSINAYFYYDIELADSDEYYFENRNDSFLFEARDSIHSPSYYLRMRDDEMIKFAIFKKRVLKFKDSNLLILFSISLFENEDIYNSFYIKNSKNKKVFKRKVKYRNIIFTIYSGSKSVNIAVHHRFNKPFICNVCNYDFNGSNYYYLNNKFLKDKTKAIESLLVVFFNNNVERLYIR